MSINKHYRDRKTKFNRIKKILVATGNLPSRLYSTQYNSNKLNDLYASGNLNNLASYLYKSYEDVGELIKKEKQGPKDPCFHYILCKIGFFKSSEISDCLYENWHDILNEALEYFFRSTMRLFDESKGVKFSTFFNNMFPQCVYFLFFRDFFSSIDNTQENIIEYVNDYPESPIEADFSSINLLSYHVLNSLRRL